MPRAIFTSFEAAERFAKEFLGFCEDTRQFVLEEFEKTMSSDEVALVKRLVAHYEAYANLADFGEVIPCRE